MNTPQFHAIYLLNSLMMATITHHKTRQFNFSLRVKINHIEFEDKFFDKTNQNVKDFFCWKTAKGMF